MPDALDKEEQLFQNLKDAGCSEEEIQNCMLDKEKGSGLRGLSALPD